MKFFLPFLAASLLFAADSVPDWVREAAAQKVPEYPAKVSSVALLREETVTADAEGHRAMRERCVLRVLQRTSDGLTAFRSYNAKTGRIRDFRGWLITPDGAVKQLGKDRIAEAGSTRYTYDEYRAKVLDVGAGNPPGTVFAYEVVEEEKTVFTQYQFWFQTDEPVLVSRFVLNVPSGWEVRGTVFHHEAMQPVAAASSYTWELHNLPWIEDEEYSPELHALVPRLALSYFPNGDNRAGLRSMKDWAAVSAWTTELADPAAEVTETIRAKAVELTKGATSELDKIRAIAAFAQKTNYVSVQMNLNRGGGYTPHAAADILEHNYGDCKDKSTLMRSLLKAAGIDSYMISIYSGDRGFVQPEWPATLQFNHAIVAVRVSAGTAAPSVLEHPRLGRLLIFDPTDPATQVGDLPKQEQGSHALVLAGLRGELVRMPLLAPAASRIESKVDAKLDLNGQLQAQVDRDYFGQSASGLRYFSSHRRPDELKKSFERGLARNVGGLALNDVTVADSPSDGRLELKLRYEAQHFGQVMQGRLLILNPGNLAPGNDYAFQHRERKLPVKLAANVRKDTVTVQLPPGFRPDEVPDPVRLESKYGKYDARWKVQGQTLSFEQTIEVKDTIAPATEYGDVRAFFEKLTAAQASPVVLVKQ